MRYQELGCQNGTPAVADLAYRADNFVQVCNILTFLEFENTSGDRAVSLIELVCQLAARFPYLTARAKIK